jgi:hypothetical protein
MKTLAIIGSAGRGTDAEKISSELYTQMFEEADKIIEEYEIDRIVSGGAAFADFLAVEYAAWIKTHLYLPTDFSLDKEEFIGYDYNSKRIARTCNFYYEQFEKKRTLARGILKYMIKDEILTYDVVYGFHERNMKVAADCDYLLAFTFGPEDWTTKIVCNDQTTGYHNSKLARLKDGGTAHTWNHSTAKLKIHINLSNLLDPVKEKHFIF